MSGPGVPTGQCRRDDIAAAVTAHNDAGQEPLLPTKAVHLLAVMFADVDIYQRNLDSLVGKGVGWNTISRLLRLLIEAGFLSKEQGRGQRPNTFRLHLPPRRQP
jgi:hypothetical protein